MKKTTYRTADASCNGAIRRKFCAANCFWRDWLLGNTEATLHEGLDLAALITRGKNLASIGRVMVIGWSIGLA